MRFHPRPDKDGNPKPIHEPHEPTAEATWLDGRARATAVPDGILPPSLSGIPFRAWTPPEDWRALPEAAIPEPEPPPGKVPGGAGLVMLEGDGRVWLVAPTNAFGGYAATYPKGHRSRGLSLQQTALKEAWEESGLRGQILAHLVDVPRSTSRTRYYLAQRIGGHPGAMGWESQAVHLAPRDQLPALAPSIYDQPIHAALAEVLRRRPWGEVVQDWLGAARRLAYTLEGFAIAYGSWPTRLLVGPEILDQIQAQLTPAGFRELQAHLRIDIQPRSCLRVADDRGRVFDYDDEAHPIHPSAYPTDPATLWLWGVVQPVFLG